MWLVILGVICAAISVYYYFRVIQAMYFKDGERQDINTTMLFRWKLVALAGFLIFLGIFPEWLITKLWYFAY